MKNQLLVSLLLVCLASRVQAFHSKSDSIGVRKRTNNHQLKDYRLLQCQQLATRLMESSNTWQLHAAKPKFKNFEEVLATYQDDPLMVMFTAVNCGPCRLMKKEVKQVTDMVGPDSSLKVFAIDTEQYPHVGSRFQVAALPCLLLVQHGEPVLRIEGVQKAEQVLQQIQTITTL